jgi:lysophospholipase L1-like esterase
LPTRVFLNPHHVRNAATLGDILTRFIRWPRFLAISLLLPVIDAGAQSSHQDFALKDGDTVVFFGDSNTEWGTYPRDVENYTLLRFPDRRIRFINAGLDGDMASKAFFRLDRDVFAAGATVVFVLFGINDISWGNYAGPEFRKTFLDYTAKIVDACRKHHARVYVLSYPITDAPAGKKTNDPYGRFLKELSDTDQSFLQQLGDETMKLARDHGAQTIDIEREMRRIRRSLPPDTRLHLDDGVHLNELGSEVLAFALLEGLHAPGMVSSVSIDARQVKLAAADSAAVTGLRQTADTLRFTRLDRGLPLTFWAPVDSSGASIERVFEPVNGYFLSITGLPADKRFTLEADGSPLSPSCGFTAAELGGRLNLAAVKSDRWLQRGGWAQQAMALARITEAKADLDRALAYTVRNELRGEKWKQMRSQVAPALTSAAAAQRIVAKPVAYHFELKPLPSDSVARCATGH